MRIRTRENLRTIKSFDRAENLAQKTKSGLTDAGRTAEQLQETTSESGVEYAGARMEEGEARVGEYATYGMERMGRWGLRVSTNTLKGLRRRRFRRMPDLKLKIPKERLPLPKRKALPSARNLLQGSGKTAKTSIKASQKLLMVLKRTIQGTVKLAKAVIKSTATAVKAFLAVAKDVIAMIVAGGWVAVIIILIVCLAGFVVGCFYGSPELLA